MYVCFRKRERDYYVCMLQREYCVCMFERETEKTLTLTGTVQGTPRFYVCRERVGHMYTSIDMYIYIYKCGMHKCLVYIYDNIYIYRYIYSNLFLKPSLLPARFKEHRGFMSAE